MSHRHTLDAKIRTEDSESITDLTNSSRKSHHKIAEDRGLLRENERVLQQRSDLPEDQFVVELQFGPIQE